MSKEKTRAELHAEVADLKAKMAELEAKYENTLKHAADERAEYYRLENAHKVLLSEHEACGKSLNRANSVIEERNRENACLNKALKLSGEANDKLIQERDAANARIERMQDDLDKAQYIAADLLEHGVFHFLIVKYRNLRAK